MNENNALRTALGNAAVAALYAALTVALAPLSYGPVQVRLSEWMVLLAFYNKKWVPGLTVGCLLANLASPFGAADILVGTLATFLAAAAMSRCPNVFLASLCPVVANGVLIGAELAVLAAIPGDALSVLAVMLYIAAGEALSVTVTGTLLFRLLLRNPALRRIITE